MSEILTDREKQNRDQAAIDEKILHEIESSFCVAGYDVLDVTVEQLGRKLKQA